MSTLPKTWLKKNWIDVCSDTNWQDFGGTWAKKHGEHGFYFVQFFSEAEMREASLTFVCPQKVEIKDKKAALSYTGNSDPVDQADELELAYALNSYGIKAYIEEFCDGKPESMRANAFKLAESLMKEENMPWSRLGNIANKLGSTQYDFLCGNSLAGLDRYTQSIVETGKAENPEKNLMLKLQYGVEVEELQNKKLPK